MKCLSRITRQHKKAKADSIWPETINGPVDPLKLCALELCGGDVTFDVYSYMDGGCSCCGYATLSIDLTCSRCKNAYIVGIIQIQNDPKAYILKVLNG